MCLAECRIHEQNTQSEKIISDMFEMVPHWQAIRKSKSGFYLTMALFTKETFEQDDQVNIRLAFELPPIMLPRKVKQ